MRRPARRRAFLVIPAIVLSVWAGYSTYVFFWVFTAEDRSRWGNEGFPSDARKWRALIGPIPDPESVESTCPQLLAARHFVRERFANDEWVFGTATDSHEGELLLAGC